MSLELLRSATKVPTRTGEGVPGDGRLRPAQMQVGPGRTRPTHRDKVVLYLGQLNGAQYAELVILAYKELIKEQKDISLLIVGGGSHLSGLKEFTKNQGLEHDVVFTGFVHDDDVPKCLACADVAVASFEKNKITECKSPLKIGEYLGSGKAIVASDVGEIRRMVADAGIIVQPGNPEEIAHAVLKILDNEKLKKKLEINARKHAEENYNWDITVENTPNNSPDAPSNPSPADGAIDVSLSPTLSVDVSDSDGDTMDVSFYDEFDVLIGTDIGVVSGGSASVVWSGLDYSTTYGWYAVADDNNGGSTSSTTWYFTTTAEPSSPNFYANSDINVQNGGISGSYVDTLDQDDVSEGITEAKTGPRTKMEHKWTIDITGSFNQFIFNIDAYHTANLEGDDFVFAYSTDNVVFTDMLTVTKTSDNDVYQTYLLPSSLSGTVYIRVKDTDQTKGNTVKDTIYVDHMYIVASNQPNLPPAMPTNPDPSNGATGVDINPTLSVTVSDPNGDSMDVTFYDASDDSVIDVDSNAPSGGTASVVWPNLTYETAYSWYAVADDGEYTSQSGTWSFTTGSETSPGGMYVWDISWVSNRHLKSIITIRRDSDGDGVAEATDALVTGANVYFTLTHQPTGDYTDYIGSTGDTGTVTFTWKKAPSGNYEGIVTDVTHSSYSYTSAMDVDNPDYFTK